MTLQSIQLTPRDLEIIYHVRMFGYLRSQDHLLPLFDNKMRVLRRASLLAKHKYLYKFPDRPIYDQALFGINNKGARLIHKEFGVPAPKVHWPQKHEERSDGWIKHELLVASTMVKIMAAAEKDPNIRFIPLQEIYDHAPVARRDLFFTVPDSGRPQDHKSAIEARVFYDGAWSKLWIKFDWIFGLENLATGARSYFYFEAGRGTETEKTTNLAIATYTKKFLVYQAALEKLKGRRMPTINKKLFGIPLIRPLFLVTPRNRRYPGTERKQNCIAWHQELSEDGEGSADFLFIDKSFLQQPDTLTVPIDRGNGETTTLLDLI